MWEQWRAHIDLTVRDAELARDRRASADSWSELRDLERSPLDSVRAFGANALRRLRAQGRTTREARHEGLLGIRARDLT